MAGLKVRPGMDKPKLREAMTAPKDAASTLKKQYEEQQRDRQPGRKSPERYATDRAEGTAKGAAVFAADRMRKTVQHHRKQDRENVSEYEKRPANGAAAPRQADHDAAPYGKKPSSIPGNSVTQFPRPEGQQSSATRVAAPEKLQDAAHPMAPGAEERGRDLARAKHQTELKRRAEIERWETYQETPHYKAPGVKVSQGLLEERPRRFSGQKTSHSALDTQGSAPRKLLTEKQKPLAVSSQYLQQGVPGKPERTIGRAQSVLVGPTHRANIVSPGGTPWQRGKRLAQKKAQRELLKRGAEAGKKAASSGGRSLQIIVTSVGRAAGKVAGSLSATWIGLVLLVLFLLIIAIGGLTASPFGILFAGESAGPEAVPVSTAVAQVNQAFNAKLEEL